MSIVLDAWFSTFDSRYSNFDFPHLFFQLPPSTFRILIAEVRFPISAFRFPILARFSIFEFWCSLPVFRCRIFDSRYSISDLWISKTDVLFLISDCAFWFLFFELLLAPGFILRWSILDFRCLVSYDRYSMFDCRSPIIDFRCLAFAVWFVNFDFRCLILDFGFDARSSMFDFRCLMFAFRFWLSGSWYFRFNVRNSIFELCAASFEFRCSTFEFRCMFDLLFYVLMFDLSNFAIWWMTLENRFPSSMFDFQIPISWRLASGVRTSASALRWLVVGVCLWCSVFGFRFSPFDWSPTLDVVCVVVFVFRLSKFCFRCSTFDV